MDLELIEFSRCRDGDTVAEVKSVLDAAQIPYRVGTTATNFDISTIGSGSEPEVIISVRRADFSAARAAMEEEHLKVELPADYYLLKFTDEELAEVLGKPSEWSPFDVAHARKLAGERGVDPAAIERQSAERMSVLRQGKPASGTLLFFGWLFSVLGGVIGLGIAWSICSMKEKTHEGEFFTYDEQSRGIGKRMLLLACVMTGLALLLRLSSVLSTDQ